MDKPFLTFDEQIHKLKHEYNLTINDECFAKEVLASLSYYDIINGYQSIYRHSGKYEAGTTIEQLVFTHMFNKNIQGVLLKYSTYVENSFKTVLSHVVANNFSEHQNHYLDVANYERSRSLEKREKLNYLLERLKNTCETCTDTPTKHYRDSKNHIPPWILFRNISFSQATDLFTYLKTTEKKQFFSYIQIINRDELEYENKVRLTYKALTLVRKFRNTIAHNLNFLNYRESYLDKNINILFVDTLIDRKEIGKVRNDIWGMVIAIVVLLNNKYLAQNFLAEFNSFMKLDDDLAKIYCEITGIPFDFEERINRYLIKLGFSESMQYVAASSIL